MRLTNKNILIISPEPWDHIFVSKHHYAIYLGQRGNRVFFLGPPSDGFECNPTNYANVFVANYRGFPKGLRFYPSFLQRKIIRRVYDGLENLCGIKFDVIWSFDNSVFFDFSALSSEVLKISHIVDLNQNFQTAQAAMTADVCLCTTEGIKNKLLGFNRRVFKINHGFNLHMGTEATAVMPGKSKIKATYAGNLAMPYIDWMLIYNVVKDNPEVDFVFIGPGRESDTINIQQSTAKHETMELSNVFLIGRVKSNELLKYEIDSDVLLVAYQEKFHEDQANPHKMMEYLGSGKMIVATHTAEFKKFADEGLILMSNKNEQFRELFKKSILNLPFWNSKEKSRVRIEIALNNTYDKQIERIENHLSLLII